MNITERMQKAIDGLYQEAKADFQFEVKEFLIRIENKSNMITCKIKFESNDCGIVCSYVMNYLTENGYLGIKKYRHTQVHFELADYGYHSVSIEIPFDGDFGMMRLADKLTRASTKRAGWKDLQYDFDVKDGKVILDCIYIVLTGYETHIRIKDNAIVRSKLKRDDNIYVKEDIGEYKNWEELFETAENTPKTETDNWYR